MKQVLMTVVLAEQQQPNIPPITNLLRLLDMVEIAINNAPFVNTELSPFYLNLGYHHHFWFDVPKFDEATLKGDKTIQVNDCIAKMRADWSLVYTALHHKHARPEKFCNRKRADYLFKVWQAILITQRKHHRNQLSTVVPMTAKAVGPFKIKKQITQKTFEIGIPTDIMKKIRTVLHSSELIPSESRD